VLCNLHLEQLAIENAQHQTVGCYPQPGAALLVTGFIALQDIVDDMGPTVMVPRSATVACHDEWQRSVGVSEQGLVCHLRQQRVHTMFQLAVCQVLCQKN
jgi:hypothetical protein